MKLIATILLLAVTGAQAGTPLAAADAVDGVAPRLIALEKQSWDAWKAHDDKFFAAFLSADHVEVGARGVNDKQQVVAGVASPLCRVEEFAVDRFQVTRLTADTAVVVYHARQKTLCGTVAVPSPAWVTSLYVRRDGRWLNALFQQSPTDR